MCGASDRRSPFAASITTSLSPLTYADSMSPGRCAHRVFRATTCTTSSRYLLLHKIVHGLWNLSLSCLGLSHSSNTSADTPGGYYVQNGAKLNAAKIPVVFLLVLGYMQQTWVMHYIASVIIDVQETIFCSLCIGWLLIGVWLAGERRSIRNSHVHPDVVTAYHDDVTASKDVVTAPKTL